MAWPLSGDFTNATVHDIPSIIAAIIKAVNQRQDYTVKPLTTSQLWPYWNSSTGAIAYKKDVTEADIVGAPLMGSFLGFFAYMLYDKVKDLLGYSAQYYLSDQGDQDSKNGMFAWWAGNSNDWKDFYKTGVGSTPSGSGFVAVSTNGTVPTEWTDFSSAYDPFTLYQIDDAVTIFDQKILTFLQAAVDLLDIMTAGIWQPFLKGYWYVYESPTPTYPGFTSLSSLWASLTSGSVDSTGIDLSTEWNHKSYVRLSNDVETYTYTNYTGRKYLGNFCKEQYVTTCGLSGIYGTKTSVAWCYAKDVFQLKYVDDGTQFSYSGEFATSFSIGGESITIDTVRDFEDAEDGATLSCSWPGSFSDETNLTFEHSPSGSYPFTLSGLDTNDEVKFTDYVQLYFANPYYISWIGGTPGLFKHGTAIITDLSSLLDDQ